MVTVTALAPSVPSAPIGLTAGPAANFENALVISWNSVLGATYYALRKDNNSDSWLYGTVPALMAACIAESTTDNALLQQEGSEYNGLSVGGIDACGNTTATTVSLFSIASRYNHIWVYACNASGCSSASHIIVTLPPPSPTIVSATCDAGGNARVEWNAIPVPGGLDRHYSFRLDNGANSWQYDLNNYRTNHDACVNDTVDASGVLARSSGAGTDYCGNIRNAYWEGVINPNGTQKAWVHTKSRNYLTFGNVPQTDVTFTCSAPAPTQCSNGIDDADPEDTLIDMADPGCSSPSDTNETNAPAPTQCSNGIDDADPEDTLIDMADPGCSSPSDTDETNASALPSLTALPRLLKIGQPGKLIWNTNGPHENTCTLTGGPSVGNLIVVAGPSNEEGERTGIMVNAKTTYTLTCGGLLDSATFEVTSINFET